MCTTVDCAVAAAIDKAASLESFDPAADVDAR
jgi:hypothetical protein